MNAVRLLHDLVDRQRDDRPDVTALVHRHGALCYADLAFLQDGFAGGLQGLGLAAGERVGIYLSKSPQAVAAAFGSSKAGGCFVPIHPVSKPGQVAHIVNDCGVRVLVTSPERLATLAPVLARCASLRHVVVTGAPTACASACEVTAWADFVRGAGRASSRRLDSDMAAILYTSGSTGLPKGVVLSHRNLVSGADSVASYLDNHEGDRLLAALPLSFDAGLSQLTTAFTVGASAVLLDYLTPHEVVRTLASERITGMTAVSALWNQLAQIDWPDAAAAHLRYFANTGGKMPLDTLSRLRQRAPHARPFLMYGLTEAFRSTYLPPEEVDRRPHSIGKAIPNQEVLVLRPDGSRCDPREPGELVHRGSTVTLGYWGDPERTAQRFRPLPPMDGLTLPEVAVFSGDTVEMDEEGFLYFIGRRDEMIKSSGYRISPVEVEEAAYGTRLVDEVAVFGIPDPAFGQVVAMVAWPCARAAFDLAAFRLALERVMPPYMQPAHVHVADAPLPRNGNGKIDRPLLASRYTPVQASTPSEVLA